ncbi:hypothetical protein Tco_0901487 [Tanacetum coccineum]
MSSSTSKDASQSQHKSFEKFAHAEEPSHTVEDSGMQQDQKFVTGDNDEQPADNKRQQVDFRPPQTWISQAARAKEPPTSFDELNDTSFDFSAFVMNRLKIPNLTQEIWLDRHSVCSKGGDLSRRYLTSVTKTKSATYELKWIKDLVPEFNLTSSKDVYSRRRIIAVTRLKIMKKYDNSHLEEIEVHQDDQKLYTFKECDFKRLHLQDIEDLLLLLAGGRSSIRCRKLPKEAHLTKPDTYRSNLRNKTVYTSYSDPHGIIYVDQYKRKRLIHVDELYKFSDGTLNDVRSALHDIVAGIRMESLPMRN